MTSLFVSYSRKESPFAHKLIDAFKGQDWEFWIDWEDIPPTVEWWKEIEKGIEESGVFLFLVSPDSIRSKYCRQEIECASRNGKRLIPIVVREVNAEEVPSELCKLNWIFIRENDDFQAACEKLFLAVRTDYDWVKAHRQLQFKALEWERNNHDKSLLLRGTELQFAEFQLKTNASKDPRPTDLQREFVLRSRQASDKQRRIVTSIGIGVGIALAVLAAFGWQKAILATTNERLAQTANTEAIAQKAAAQINEEEAHKQAATAKSAQATAVFSESVAVANEKEAQKQAKIARAGELAALAVSQREKQFDLSLLLSVEAFRTSNILRTRSVLLDSTQANPHLVQYMRGHNQPVFDVAFSPDGKILASGSYDGSIILWDVVNGKPIVQPLTEYSGAVNSLAFSPEKDRKLLASGGCWKTDSDYSTGCLEGKIILWDISDAASPRFIAQLSTGSNSYVSSLTFSSDGKTLASRRSDGSVILWNVSDQKQIGSLPNVQDIAFSPDEGSKLLALGSDNGIITLWDVEKRQPMGELRDPLTQVDSGAVERIIISPDGKTLASIVSNDNGITLWDVAERKVIKRLETGYDCNVTSLVFNPDGQLLAFGRFCAGVDRYTADITLWNIGKTEHPRQLIGHNQQVWGLAFSPDGNTLASGSGDTAVILWSMEKRQPIGKFSAGQSQSSGQPLTEPVISPDGKIQAFIKDTTGDEEATITLRDIDKKEPIGSLFTGQLGSISGVAFSPDGKTLASSLDIGLEAVFSITIILFDVESRQPIGPPLIGHGGTITSVAFSPDGKMLTSISRDRTIIWDLDPKSWVAVACQRAERNFTSAEWEKYFPGTPYPASREEATCPQWPLEAIAPATTP